MCTVTFIPAPGGPFITSNRDEQRARPPAVEPASYAGQTGRLLFPKDARAGGTWFVAHENGSVLVLLNGASERHSPQPSYRKSRGAVLLELADSVNCLETFKKLNLNDIQPFTLILLEAKALETQSLETQSLEAESLKAKALKTQSLFECRWDGKNKTQSLLDASLPHIWSSVTLYDPPTIQKRRSWFEKWLSLNPAPEQKDVLEFHRSTGDGDPSTALLMNREDKVLTVSITSLQVGSGPVRMYYRDLLLAKGDKWIPLHNVGPAGLVDSVSPVDSVRPVGPVDPVGPGRHVSRPAKNAHSVNNPNGAMTRWQRLAHRPFFIRFFHWEYWSFHTIYLPIYLIWVAICLRARSFFFFAAANPTIRNGGFLNESKKDIIPMIPPAIHPRTQFFSAPANAEAAMRQLKEAQFRFPLIGKPDVGGRGRGVKILRCESELKEYLVRTAIDFHIQEFVTYQKEAGIFYHRYPGEETGRLSGIARKEFLRVRGDGYSSIASLMQSDKRAILQQQSLEKIYGATLETILPDGEELELIPYGSHARGAKFLDDSHLIDEELTRVIDGICRQIPEFYFGRLDIRYRDWEELRQGKHFAVIEINGAGSEPTHIYDPAHSLFFAWKEIIRHWIILVRISRHNHRRGFPYLSTKEGIQMFRENKVWSEKLACMQE